MQIGIDLGGTKIEGIALDGASVIVPPRRVPTPRDYDRTIDAIAELVLGIEESAGRRGSVGIGIPGAMSPRTGLVKNANSVWLIGKPFKADLESRLGRPIRMANDANCFALSEAIDGAASGDDVVFGVIIGTGVGAGIAIRQAVHEGVNQIAGEWGHNPLPWMTAEEVGLAHPCYCGKRSCIETFLSGPGFERDYRMLGGAELSSPDIAHVASLGDATATEALRRYVDRLARGLAHVINILDPGVIVLGGGMSNLPNLVSPMTARLPEYVFSESVHTRVTLNAQGDSSGVRGAAWLWPQSA